MAPQNFPQQPKSPQKSDSDLRTRIQAAKSTLRMKDLNVGAAVAGHRMYNAMAAKNPKMQPNQILNRMNPNARTHYMKLANSLPSNALGSDVPMNQFRSALQKLRPLNNNTEIDFLDKEQMSEALKDEIQPSPMLVLRRKGIRIFPDGRRVALYTNDKYGLVFTIPYNAGGTGTAGSFGSQNVPSAIQAEETDPMIMESLDQVAAYAQEENPKVLAKHMKFSDGSKLKVSHGAAKAIHMVHGALNDENKKKFADMLNNPKGFEKAAHFALSKVQYTIGDK